MKNLFTILILVVFLLPTEVEAVSPAAQSRVKAGEGQPILLAKRRRRRRRRRSRGKKRRTPKKTVPKKTVPKKAEVPVEAAKPVPKPSVPAPKVLPTAVLADLSIPEALQAQWAGPLAQGLVQGLLESKEVELLTGEPLKTKLGEQGSSVVVTEDALEALRQQTEAAAGYWIRLEPIKDQVRLTAVRTTPTVSIAFTRLLGAQPPDPSWFQQAAQALMTAVDDQGFPAAPVQPAQDAEAPTVAQEDDSGRRAGPGSGLMVAGMGFLAAGFGWSLEEDAVKMEAAENAAEKSMQNSISDSRRVGERLTMGGYTLAGLGLAGALWSVVRAN